MERELSEDLAVTVSPSRDPRVFANGDALGLPRRGDLGDEGKSPGGDETIDWIDRQIMAIEHRREACEQRQAHLADLRRIVTDGGDGGVTSSSGGQVAASSGLFDALDRHYDGAVSRGEWNHASKGPSASIGAGVGGGHAVGGGVRGGGGVLGVASETSTELGGRMEDDGSADAAAVVAAAVAREQQARAQAATSARHLSGLAAEHELLKKQVECEREELQRVRTALEAECSTRLAEVRKLSQTVEESKHKAWVAEEAANRRALEASNQVRSIQEEYRKVEENAARSKVFADHAEQAKAATTSDLRLVEENSRQVLKNCRDLQSKVRESEALRLEEQQLMQARFQQATDHAALEEATLRRSLEAQARELESEHLYAKKASAAVEDQRRSSAEALRQLKSEMEEHRIMARRQELQLHSESDASRLKLSAEVMELQKLRQELLNEREHGESAAAKRVAADLTQRLAQMEQLHLGGHEALSEAERKHRDLEMSREYAELRHRDAEEAVGRLQQAKGAEEQARRELEARHLAVLQSHSSDKRALEEKEELARLEVLRRHDETSEAHRRLQVDNQRLNADLDLAHRSRSKFEADLEVSKKEHGDAQRRAWMLEAELQKHREEIGGLQAGHEEMHRRSKEELERKHLEDTQRWHLDLSQHHRDEKDKLMSAHSARLLHVEAEHRSRNEMAHNLRNQESEGKIAELERRHADEKQRLQGELAWHQEEKSKMYGMHSQLSTKAEAERTALQRSHGLAAEDTATRHEEALQKLRDEHQAALQDAEARLSRQHQFALKNLERARDDAHRRRDEIELDNSEVHQELAKHKSTMEDWEAEHATALHGLSQLRDEHRSAQQVNQDWEAKHGSALRTLLQLREEHEGALQTHQVEKQTLQRDMQGVELQGRAAQAKLQTNHQRELQDAVLQARQDLRQQLSQGHEETLQRTRGEAEGRWHTERAQVLRDAQTKHAALEGERDLAHRRREELERRHEALQQELERTTMEATGHRSALDTAHRDRAELAEKHSIAQQDLARLREHGELGMQAAREEGRRKYDDLHGRHQDVLREKDKHRGDLENLRGEHGSLRSELEAARQRLRILELAESDLQELRKTQLQREPAEALLRAQVRELQFELEEDRRDGASRIVELEGGKREADENHRRVLQDATAVNQAHDRLETNLRLQLEEKDREIEVLRGSNSRRPSNGSAIRKSLWSEPATAASSSSWRPNSAPSSPWLSDLLPGFEDSFVQKVRDARRSADTAIANASRVHVRMISDLIQHAAEIRRSGRTFAHGLREWECKHDLDLERRTAGSGVEASLHALRALREEAETRQELRPEEFQQVKEYLVLQVQRCQEELDLLRRHCTLVEVPEPIVDSLIRLASEGVCSSRDWASGASPLHWSAQKGRRDIIEFVRAQEGGAKMLNTRDYLGRTPLSYAEELERQGLAHYLRAEGSSALAPAPFSSPLASRSASAAALALGALPASASSSTTEPLALAAGPATPAFAFEAEPTATRPSLEGLPAKQAQVLAQIEAQGWEAMHWKDNYSLLHWAASKGMLDLCRYLLSFGADPCLRDGTGQSPIDVSKRAQHFDVALALQEAAGAFGPFGVGAGRYEPSAASTLSAYG